MLSEALLYLCRHGVVQIGASQNAEHRADIVIEIECFRKIFEQFRILEQVVIVV